ncbi:MAG TPA: flagellar hook basal-body protein [Bryobacteraceae bacterium]|nr:flagellar hook basal-body protein [Bryobacteraceae bacterium]
MDPISVMAAGGIRTRMQTLDLLANNLANAATSGYKGDKEFYSLFSSKSAEAGDDDGYLPKLPSVDHHWTDFSQGLLETTGNPLDMALSGDGFFTINGPSGPLYTRNGGFQRSATGTLITSEGYPVASLGGGTITLDPALQVEITREGIIKQGGADVGQLAIATFPNTNVLSKQGNSYFKNTDPKVTPTQSTTTEVNQGRLEASNIKTSDVAVHLVGVMRQFEMLHKAVSLTTDMDKKAVEEVARVGQ